MFTDPRLGEVARLLRPEVPLPAIVVTPDPAGPTRVRELLGLGLEVHFASRLTPQLAGKVRPTELDAVLKSRAVTEAWYDAPQYAGFPAFLGAQGPVPLSDDAALKGLDDVRVFTRSKDIYDLGATGKGVLVAICDTGIDDSHPMLEGQVERHLDFTGEGAGSDPQGHSTWCASAIAGRPIEYQGKVTKLRGRVLQGMADHARLLDCRVLDSNGTGQSSTIMQGIEAAVMAGARIINLSLGSLFGGLGRTPDAQLVNEAAKRGIAVCCASGNQFGFATIGSPGSAAGAITVGSVAMETPTPGSVSAFSSRGPTLDGRVKPDIMGPGGNLGVMQGGPLNEVILGASAGRIAQESGEDYAMLRGTSMATPSIAGIIAQLVPLGFPKDRAEVEGVLARSAWGRFGPGVKNNRSGWGVVDAQRAVRALEAPLSLPTRGWIGVQSLRSRPLLGAAVGFVSRMQVLPGAARPHEVRLRP